MSMLQVTLHLKGSACGPEILFSASTFSFGSVPLDGSEIRTLQVNAQTLARM